jgi:hypothetical protein
MVNPTGGGGRWGAHRKGLAAARYLAAEKKSAVEQMRGHRCSSSGRRGRTWLGEARRCGSWIGGLRGGRHWHSERRSRGEVVGGKKVNGRTPRCCAPFIVARGSWQWRCELRRRAVSVVKLWAAKRRWPRSEGGRRGRVPLFRQVSDRRVLHSFFIFQIIQTGSTWKIQMDALCSTLLHDSGD